MKFKNFLLNLAIGISALLFGLAWVGIYQFFSGVFETRPATLNVSPKIDFDINNPESVLPIDFEEDKLSDPKEDEDNPKFFDPEGRYYLLEESKKFKDFYIFTIHNKNFEVAPDDKRYGEFVLPQGTIFLEDKDKGVNDNCDMHDPFAIPKIDIENGKINFTTKKRDGTTYEFKGEFIVKGNFYTLELDEKVLKGILTKKKNGKTVAQEELTFGWDNSETCLH